MTLGNAATVSYTVIGVTNNRNGFTPSAVGLPPRADEIGKKGKLMITKEMETDILRDYNNRNMSMREIESKYHTPRSKIAKFCVEHGAEPRRPQTFGKKQKKGGQSNCLPVV